MLNVAIILGSTRPRRNGEAVAKWVYDIARRRTDATFELIDLRDVNLPLLDEPLPPSLGQYQPAPHEGLGGEDRRVRRLRLRHAGIQPRDSCALKNAIDYLFREWNHKAAGFVSYGGAGNGARAVEQLRLVMAELPWRPSGPKCCCRCSPTSRTSACSHRTSREAAVTAMLDEVLAWGGALQTLRLKRSKELQLQS